MYDMNRRDLIRSGMAGGAVLLGSGWLAACSDGDEQGDDEREAGPIQRGGVLTLAVVSLGKSETLDPGKGVAEADYIRMQALFDPLCRSLGDNRTDPCLATEWEPNDDATLWTFTLRDGVTWHDGKPFTADDVLYSVRTWASDANPIAASAVGPFLDLKKTRKRGNRTVEIALTRGVAEFPTFLSSVAGGCAIIQDGTKSFERPVGTGPFKFGSFQPGRRSEFPANENYWQEGKPYVDSLVVDTSFTDPNARINAVLSGAAHIAPRISPTQAKANSGNSRVRILSSTSPAFDSANFRIDTAPFKDQRVREALKLLVDRDQFIENVYLGYGRTGNDLPMQGLKYFNDSLQRPHDPEKAKALLKDAGQSDLRVQLKTSGIEAAFIDFATLYAQQAKAAGVTVDLDRLDQSVYYTGEGGYGTRPFAMTAWTNTRSLSLFYTLNLVKGGIYNETHFGDSKHDALVAEAMATIDESRAAELWNEVQQIQFEQGGLIIPANNDNIDAMAPGVHGVKPEPTGGMNNRSLQDIWIAKA
jgi:peptide/nickel transport system substrate-binding protein